MSAAAGRCFRERIAHLAGGAIREKAHGIEIFTGGAGGDDDGLAFEIAAKSQHLADLFDDGIGGGEAARARHSAGEIAFVGVHDVDAARAKLLQILLRGGMLPHVDVHRRSNDDRSFRGEIQCRKEIARDALREVGEDIGSSRRNEQEVYALRDRDVLDGAFDVGGLPRRQRRTFR